MQSNWTLTQGKTSVHGESDRQLSIGLQQLDATALSRLYDRYALLVFTLLCDAVSEAAESLLEDVFVEVWRKGAASSTSNVLPMLLQLTAEAVVRHRGTQASPRNSIWGRPPLPALTPFTDLPDFVFDVLVMTYLGQLTVSELAVALERDEAAILEALSEGMAFVRGQHGATWIR